MSRSAQSELALARQVGESAEAEVVQVIDGLRSVPDATAEFHDAVVESPITPSHECPMVGICLLEPGVCVELKSTIPWYDLGTQRGRFQVRRGQHQRLLEDGGVYLFAVCVPERQRRPVAMKVVPATTVDHEVVDGLAWISAGADREDYCQFSWSRVFDEQEVDSR